MSVRYPVVNPSSNDWITMWGLSSSLNHNALRKAKRYYSDAFSSITNWSNIELLQEKGIDIFKDDLYPLSDANKEKFKLVNDEPTSVFLTKEELLTQFCLQTIAWIEKMNLLIETVQKKGDVQQALRHFRNSEAALNAEIRKFKPNFGKFALKTSASPYTFVGHSAAPTGWEYRPYLRGAKKGQNRWYHYGENTYTDVRPEVPVLAKPKGRTISVSSLFRNAGKENATSSAAVTTSVLPPSPSSSAAVTTSVLPPPPANLTFRYPSIDPLSSDWDIYWQTIKIQHNMTDESMKQMKSTYQYLFTEKYNPDFRALLAAHGVIPEKEALYPLSEENAKNYRIYKSEDVVKKNNKLLLFCSGATAWISKVHQQYAFIKLTQSKDIFKKLILGFPADHRERTKIEEHTKLSIDQIPDETWLKITLDKQEEITIKTNRTERYKTIWMKLSKEIRDKIYGDSAAALKRVKERHGGKRITHKLRRTRRHKR